MVAGILVAKVRRFAVVQLGLLVETAKGAPVVVVARIVITLATAVCEVGLE